MTATPAGAVVALLLGLLGVGAALPVSSVETALAGSLVTAAEEIDEGVVAMTVAPDSFGAPVEGADVILTVTVANRTAEAVDSITVNASVNRARVTSTSMLSDWLDTAEGSIETDTTVGTVEAADIAAGDTRIVTITVPASALGFTEEGVYALGVRLLSADDPVAQARTALTWKNTATNPLGVAILAPLVLPSTAPGLLDAATLTEYTSRGGVLSDQLDAMIGTQVAIGIDPRILASIRVLGSSAPASAVEWLEQLRGASNPTFPLPYADADITSTLAAGGAALAPLSFDFAVDTTLFAAPDDTASPTPQTEPPSTETPLLPLPTTESLVAWNYTYPAMVWPTENTVTAQSFATLATTADPILLSSDNVARELAPTSSTITARVSAADGANDTGVVVSDALLSSLLQHAVNAETTAEWNSAMAEFSSMAAVSSEQAGTAVPTILATLDRTWNESGFRLSQTLTALSSLPWAAPTSAVAALEFSPTPSMGGAVGTNLSTPAPATIVDAALDQARVDTVTALLAAEAAEAQFAGIAADPLALTSARRLDLLALLSNSWLEEPTAWSAAAADFLATSTEIRNSVQIAPSSTVQLPADRGSLPVTVDNNLNQEVTVYVNVRARTPLLTVEEQFVELVIEPQSSGRAQIPVVSLSNGEVQLTVTLLDQPGGNQLGQPTTVELNVHAGWETAGTIVFGVLVFGIFAAGIVRTVRKRRRAARTAE